MDDTEATDNRTPTEIASEAADTARDMDKQYGLQRERDPSTGELQPVEHVYDSPEHGEVRIKLIPPTGQQVEAWQEIGQEMAISKMEEILDEHLVEPDVEGSYTLAELNTYVRAIADYGMGNSERAQDVQEELDERAAELGNRDQS